MTPHTSNFARFTDLLQIELPIIQAPMAGVQTSPLCIAVSNAGGLGSLPCAMLTADTLRTELQAIQTHCKRPYNVNFFCHQPPIIDPQREHNWRVALGPYFKEFGINPDEVPAGPGRAPFSDAMCDVLEDFKPPVVSFHFGLPSAPLLERVRSWGAKIMSSATTVEEALWLESKGVDAVIAQGLEAGGHRGMFLTEDITSQISTFALLPQIVARVKIPVIAAGGIADANGVAAVLNLGAAAAQVGTAYLMCHESTTSGVHRQALQSQAVHHTALTNLFTGRPARGIVNRIMRELGPISSEVPSFPLATAAIAPIRAKAEEMGSGDFSPLWSGQNASGCKDIAAADLTLELASKSPFLKLNQ
jgi:nitronate monooxygenase